MYGDLQEEILSVLCLFTSDTNVTYSVHILRNRAEISPSTNFLNSTYPRIRCYVGSEVLTGVS
jgi:hypothetical protein